MLPLRLRLLILTVILSLLLALVPAALAQDETECGDFTLIEIGDTVSDEITNRTTALAWCFLGFEGDQIVVTSEATDGDLDTYLYITDAAIETTFAENDNVSRRVTDSEIEYTIEEDGTYLIIVSRVDGEDGDTTGEFELTLEGERAERDNGGGTVGGGEVEPGVFEMADGLVTVNYPDDLELSEDSSGSLLALSNDRRAVDKTYDELDEGEFKVSVEYYTGDVIQAIPDALAENADNADLIDQFGEDASPYYVLYFELLLHPSATISEDLEEVELGDVTATKMVLEHEDLDVQSIIYAFEMPRLGDYMAVVGHVNGGRRDVGDLDDLLVQIVEDMEFARRR